MLSAHLLAWVRTRLEQDEEVWKPRAIYSVFVLSHWHRTLFIVSPAVEAKPGDHSSLDLKYWK